MESKYNKCKWEIRKLINGSKQEYIQKIVHETRDESKAMWKNLNCLCGNLRNLKIEIQQIKHEAVYYQDNIDIANIFNKYDFMLIKSIQLRSMKRKIIFNVIPSTFSRRTC